jgi:hypothetical protein
MPSILDFTLIGELALVVTVLTQAIKSHPKVRGSDIVWWAGPIGIVVSLLWYLALGKLTSGPHWINPMECYRAVANGLVGAVGASAGYNVQKMLPIPNILPTVTEIDEQNIKEEVARQEHVVDAVVDGVEPDKAKEVVGLEKNEPPPVENLEEIQPPLNREDEPIG